MKKIDKLALKAKYSEPHFEKLINRLMGKLERRWLRFPNYVKFNYSEKGDLISLIWEVVRRYNHKEGEFMCFLNSNINFLVKAELRSVRKNLRNKTIFQENCGLYREPCHSMVEILAEKEAFILACNELMEYLSNDARRIFTEKVNPSRKTIDISIKMSFMGGGSDKPVRLKWKHIASSVGIPYLKVIDIVNNEIMPMADLVFRKYGFHNPYEYRDGPKVFFVKQ